MPMADNRAEFLRGMRVSFPVLLGFIPFGLLLGSQAAIKDFFPARYRVDDRPQLCRRFGIPCGPALDLATDHPLLIGLTILVNSRHILMSATLAPTMRHLPRRKVLPALALMCDESWALGLDDARKRGGVLSFPFYLGLSTGLYLSWPTSAGIGALVGPILGDVTRYGIHMAFPAVFLVMIFGMWTGFRTARPWFVSLVVGALTYLAVPGPWYVPAGALSGLIAAYLWARPE